MVKRKSNGVVGYEVDVEIEAVDLLGFSKCSVDADWSCVGFRLLQDEDRSVLESRIMPIFVSRIEAGSDCEVCFEL